MAGGREIAMEWLYYLHTNGELISKNPVVVRNDAEYFNSPFVKKIWRIDTEDRMTLYPLLFEALALGANMGRIKLLAEKLGATRKDSYEYMVRKKKPSELEKRGLIIFIEKILKMDTDTYFLELKEAMEPGEKESARIV